MGWRLETKSQGLPDPKKTWPTAAKQGGLAALAVALFLWIGACPAAVAAEEQVVQIRIAERHVDDILPAAEPLLSPQGFISADRRSNSLIVIDNPAVIARIRQLVEKLDQEVARLKIRVQYVNVRDDAASAAQAAARAKAGDTTAEIGSQPLPAEGLEADVSAERTRTQRQSEYVIRVRSGSAAYIEAAYDVPHRDRWQQLSHRYGYVPETIVFQRVASGYNVRPILVGDQVQIEITPRINYFDNRGRDQKIHFAEAATTLFVPLDEWVDIGSVMGGHRDINRQILTDSRHKADQGLTMRLMVTID